MNLPTMIRQLLLAICLLSLISCGSSKSSKSSGSNTKEVSNIPQLSEKSSVKLNSNTIGDDSLETTTMIGSNKAENIINYAKTFEGTRYKFGGTTKAGMDCSGLIYTSFKQEDILMPRISRDMATKGIQISVNDVQEGDLVFFKTSKRNTINHVGLVVKSNRGEIHFIHSTTSLGVIISSMDESYWKKAFVEARRVI